MKRLIKDGNALNGHIKLSFKKVVRNLTCLIVGLYGLVYFCDYQALLATFVITNASMYIGVVAYHRLLIHRSFSCPQCSGRLGLGLQRGIFENICRAVRSLVCGIFSP